MNRLRLAPWTTVALALTACGGSVDEALIPDSAPDDAASVDVAIADVAIADVATADAGAPDTAAIDAAGPDVGALDAGPSDAPSTDAPDGDGTTTDAGSIDATTTDSTSGDAPSIDGTIGDMGATDAPSSDAGADGSTPVDAGPLSAGLHIAPADPILIYDLSTSTPPTQAFTASLVDAMGGATDVTGSATFTLDDATFGKFVGASFLGATSTATTVGVATTQVHAQASALEASTSLSIVRMHATPTASEPGETLFTSPAGGAPTPTSRVISFVAGGGTYDIAIVLDTTGSMAGEISAIDTGLEGDLISQLRAISPTVGVGLVDFKDTNSGCGPDPYVVRVDAPIDTTSTTLTAASGLSASGGCDTPEANVAAMAYALTGAADPSLQPALAGHTSPTGHFGGVDFRQGATPIVVMISDASWHDPSGATSLATLEGDFKAAGAIFVGIVINLGTGDSSEAQAEQLSDATGSALPASRFGGTCPSTTNAAGECRLNFPGQSNGAGITDAIVAALTAIDAGGGATNARVKLSNAPGNPGGVDATTFVQSVRAMDEGYAADGCAPHAASDTDGDGIKDTFTGLALATTVCFEVDAKSNTTVAATTAAQLFTAYATLEGEPGDVPTSAVDTLLFVVPVAK